MEPSMITLSAEIADRVSRGVETVHRIRQLELQVAERTAELRELALRDELTHLYNRRGFLALAEHQLKTHRRSGQPLLLFYGDLDGLKYVNDTWGHDAGDDAIRTAARILTDSFRTEDLVARMGGDEFVMLAPGCTSDDAERLSLRLETLFDRESRGQYGISLGWIMIDPAAKKPLEEWLVLADEALYRTKIAKKSSRILPPQER
jgi:diguanylate cyclase (GGDEF)-like protein